MHQLKYGPMNFKFLSLLRSPNSGCALRLDSKSNFKHDGFYSCADDQLVEVITDGQNSYQVINGIPHFAAQSNYADSFGMQWNYFAKTQLDSYSGHPISAIRFWNSTSWNPGEMREKWVLDVGCGSGRFAEIALLTGAHVVALDYSSAVDLLGQPEALS